MATKTMSEPIQSRHLLDEYVYGSSKFMEIPVDQLKIDMSYQREFAETLVTRIVSRFDFDKFEPPTVNVRPDGNHYVVDGGHRTEAARRSGIRTLTCRIVNVDPADEPALFLELNRQRRWVTPVQTFKAEVKSGTPSSIEIQRCLGDRGLRVASSHSPQTVSCTSTLHMIYSKGGTVGLSRVLDTALVWPEDEPRRFAGQLLRGIELFFEMTPNVDLDRMKDRLSKITTGTLLSRSSSRWHAWRSLDQRGGSLIDATAEEIKKQYLKR